VSKRIQEVLATFSPRHWTPVARNVAAARDPRVCWKRVTVTIAEYGEKIRRDSNTRARAMLSRQVKYRCRDTAPRPREILF